MCVTSAAVASKARNVPDLVNSWMINPLSEGHRNTWVLQGWFIKDETERHCRSFVTDGGHEWYLLLLLAALEWGWGWQGDGTVGAHSTVWLDELSRPMQMQRDTNSSQTAASRGICFPSKGILPPSMKSNRFFFHSYFCILIFLSFHTALSTNFKSMTAFVTLVAVILLTFFKS